MMDCKNALNETRRRHGSRHRLAAPKGLSKAAKKASRTAAEGLVGVAVDGTKGVCSKSIPRPISSPATKSSRISCARPREVALTEDGVEALKDACLAGRRHRAQTLTRTSPRSARICRCAARPLSVDPGVVALLRPQSRRAEPRQDRRAGRAESQQRRATICRRWASSSPCTSPRPFPLALSGEALMPALVDRE